MNVKFLSSASSDDEARAVWRDTTVDMIVVRRYDGKHLIFGRATAGMRILAEGGMGVSAASRDWAIYPTAPIPMITASCWHEALVEL